ncbi:MAG: hypothetical protein H7X86_12865 [Gorillibacterium sp.]|nr:hypothetical protein [Gorillibacterium sp.]
MKEDKQAINEPKKVSLADAIRRQLEQKKKVQADTKGVSGQRAGNERRKSQMTKKVNNQHRRTGGS